MGKKYYNLYLDETGFFGTKGSAIVGFYIKYDFQVETQKAFVRNFQDSLKQWLDEKIASLRVNRPTELAAIDESYLKNYVFSHCRENSDINQDFRRLIQCYMVTEIKKYFNALKDKEYIEDFNIVIFSQDLKYNSFDRDYRSEELFDNINSNINYLKMMAEGIIKFWKTIKCENASAILNVFIASKYNGILLGTTVIESYVKNLVTAAGTILKEREIAQFYNEFLSYKILNSEKKACGEVQCFDYKRFAEDKFHQYLYNQTELYTSAEDRNKYLDYVYHSHSNPWKFLNIKILYNEKDHGINIFTIISDYFANTYFNGYLNSSLDDNAKQEYQKALDGNTFEEYKTLTKSYDMSIDYQNLLNDKNIVRILESIIIDPEIKQTKKDHDNKYISSYHDNIMKWNKILESTKKVFQDCSEREQDNCFKQIISKLQVGFSQNHKRLKNKLVIDSLKDFFEDFFNTNPAFSKYVMDFDLFLLKIQLDFNDIENAEMLAEEIKDKIKQIDMSNADRVNYRSILTTSLLNYYNDVFDYAALESEYNQFMGEFTEIDIAKGKATNIYLGTKIRDIKQCSGDEDRNELLNKVAELKEIALDNFQYAYSSDKLRTYQIYAQLTAMLLSEESIGALYQAAGLPMSANISDLVNKIFKDNCIDDQQKFLFITFLDVLIGVRAFRDQVFNTESNPCFTLKPVKNSSNYPDCLIYQRLANLTNILYAENKNINEYFDEKLEKVINKVEENIDIQAEFLKMAENSLAEIDSSTITLFGMKILIKSEYLLHQIESGNVDIAIDLSNLRENVDVFASQTKDNCPIASIILDRFKSCDSTNPEEIKPILTDVIKSLPF